MKLSYVWTVIKIQYEFILVQFLLNIRFKFIFFNYFDNVVNFFFINNKIILLFLFLANTIFDFDPRPITFNILKS